MENQTMTTTHFVNALVKQFASKKTLPSRTQLAKHLYAEYKEQLSAPRLDVSNLSAVMKYVDTHMTCAQKARLTKKDLAKVIKKAVPASEPALRLKDFYQMLGQTHLYDHGVPVMPNRNGYTMSRREVMDVYDFFLSHVELALKSKCNLRLSGLGTFYCVQQKAHEQRNPQTGKKMKIPAKMRARFKPASGLKRSLAKLPVKSSQKK